LIDYTKKSPVRRFFGVSVTEEFATTLEFTLPIRSFMQRRVGWTTGKRFFTLILSLKTVKID